VKAQRMRKVECGIRNSEWGRWNGEWGVRNAERRRCSKLKLNKSSMLKAKSKEFTAEIAESAEKRIGLKWKV